MKHTIFRHLAVCAFTLAGMIGAMVMLGWRYDLQWALSLRVEWGTMKIITAACIVLLSVTGLIVSVKKLSTDTRWDASPRIHTAIIGLGMATLAILSLSFQTDPPLAAFDHGGSTVMPGVPSIGAMIVVLLLVVAGCLHSFHNNNSGLKKRLASKMHAAALAITGLALFGYAVDAPVLYYYWPSHTNAMAFHAAVGLNLIAVGYVCLYRSLRYDREAYSIQCDAVRMITVGLIFGLYLQNRADQLNLRNIFEAVPVLRTMVEPPPGYD